MFAIAFESSFQAESRRIQLAVENQCRESVDTTRLAFRLDDTGTEWSHQRPDGSIIQCKLNLISDEWECRCN